MKFFESIVLLLVIASVSLGEEHKEVRAKAAKGHEKESRSALYNGGLSSAHQDKHRGWNWGYQGDADGYRYFLLLRILGQVQDIAQNIREIREQLGIPPNDNSTTTESANETSDEPIETTETSYTVDEDDDEDDEGLTTTTTTTDSGVASDRSRSNSASRARLAHGHSKSKKAGKSHSKTKSHSNHVKGHSKSHNEKKN